MTDIASAVETVRKRFSANDLPVNLEALAEEAGVTIKYSDFETQMSGFAYQKQSTRYIGVNKDESHARQRFTIAHELGHLFLHQSDPLSYDASVEMIHFRDDQSTLGVDKKEIEANAFAAELLMPEAVIRKEIRDRGITDLEDAVGLLANIFDVSQTAITVRLTKLYVSH